MRPYAPQQQGHAAAAPGWAEIDDAHRAYTQREPRSVMYRATLELVASARRGQSSLDLAEALAVLLMTWNVSYYRFHGPFNEQHFREIELLLDRHRATLEAVRCRDIGDFTSADEATISAVFTDFEKTLGPVGAAKALHALASEFFPLWDRRIYYSRT